MRRFGKSYPSNDVVTLMFVGRKQMLFLVAVFFLSKSLVFLAHL